MFIDEAMIHLEAGDGGDGAVSFRREAFVPHGGPDGGDGGRGGSIYLHATEELNTLYGFHRKQRFKAGSGGNGVGSRKHGAKGSDLVIPVPVGTIAYDSEGVLVADLAAPGAEALVAKGGRGGLGNIHFTTSVQQAPRIAQKGEPGEEMELRLELRLLADVGLVGLPNAGKSTLLAMITAARPKIADYPFTTLIPNLGVVAVDETTFVVADIPGLIEGSHLGAGLGLEFLRHVQRTKLLVHVIDGISAEPLHDLEVVNKEMAQYEASLGEKPQVVAVNKMDLPAAREAWPALSKKLKRRGTEAVAISAATGEGVQDLVNLVAAMLKEMGPKSVESEEGNLRVYRLEATREDEIVVAKEGNAYRLTGRAAERAAALTNVETPEGMAVLRQRLSRMGVEKMLRRAGAAAGDRVRVGGVEFTWEGPRR
jgi:GTPase